MYRLYFTKDSLDLKEILNKDYCIYNYEIVYNKFNKPYIKGNPIYFNISHDELLTVIVVSNKEVGVDIQHLTYKEGVIKHSFNKNEQLIMSNSLNKEYDFTRIWVMKEAYLKCLGEGIGYGLKNVDTTKLNDKIKVINKETYLIAICESEV